MSEAKKQPVDLPLWVVTQQESIALLLSNQKGLQISMSFLCISVSVFLTPSYSPWLIPVNLSLASFQVQVNFINTFLEFLVQSNIPQYPSPKDNNSQTEQDKLQ